MLRDVREKREQYTNISRMALVLGINHRSNIPLAELVSVLMIEQ